MDFDLLYSLPPVLSTCGWTVPYLASNVGGGDCGAVVIEGCTIHDCSPIPVFCFLYPKIFPVTKMRLNVCFNEMALFGLFAALIKGCSSYGRNGGQSTRGDG